MPKTKVKDGKCEISEIPNFSRQKRDSSPGLAILEPRNFEPRRGHGYCGVEKYGAANLHTPKQIVCEIPKCDRNTLPGPYNGENHLALR